MDGSQRILSILGVYMPSADQAQEVYSEYSLCYNHIEFLISVLRVLSLLQVTLTPILEAETDHKSVTTEENQWNRLIDNHNLYNISLGCLSSGPTYTYSSGGNFTTVDYILTNSDGSRGVSSCSVDHPLNTSDHLPSSIPWTSLISGKTLLQLFLLQPSTDLKLKRRVMFTLTQRLQMMS